MRTKRWTHRRDEMENEKKFVTDLVDQSAKTVILQPAITVGMRKFEDILRIYGHFSSFRPRDKERCVWEAVRSIADSRWFVHAGTLTSYHARLEGGDKVPPSYDYQHCGDFFEAAVNDRGELAWYCENCDTMMRIYHVNQADIPDLLLHLLIKQMVPTLRTGNFVWTEETGVVGILRDGLSYCRRADPSLSSFGANLGFVFMPGMQTLEGLGGFEEWLRYLVQVKFDQLQVMAESQLPSLIGPRHMGQLNKGLRFWRG